MPSFWLCLLRTVWISSNNRSKKGRKRSQQLRCLFLLKINLGLCLLRKMIQKGSQEWQDKPSKKWNLSSNKSCLRSWFQWDSKISRFIFKFWQYASWPCSSKEEQLSIRLSGSPSAAGWARSSLLSCSSLPLDMPNISSRNSTGRISEKNNLVLSSKKNRIKCHWSTSTIHFL